MLLGALKRYHGDLKSCTSDRKEFMENHYRNIFHLEPPNGLLNDPNGVAYFKGTYYVFHQWNRFSCDHSYKEWGVFTSKNLVDWQHRGSAILPDSLQDSHGVYSGAAVVLDGQMRIFYTGNTKKNQRRKSYQQMAMSEDGQTFIKTRSLETPEGLTEHHRDPKVFYFQNSWYMVVGSQTQERVGAIALYTSLDLENWAYQGIFFEHGSLEQMCECPDVLDFGEYQALLVCPQKRDVQLDQDLSSYSGFYLGKIEAQRFLPETELALVDYGFDFYAPQTFRDPQGRYLLWAWMSRMSEEEEQACPTKKFGYVHCLTMPREVVLERGKLLQKPLKELLDRKEIVERNRSDRMVFFQEKEALLLEIDFTEHATQFQLNFSDGMATLFYQQGVLVLRRRSWYTHQLQEKHVQVEAIRHVSIFLDQSALEIFINSGEFVMSLRYFSKDDNKQHQFFCETHHESVLSILKIGGKNGLSNIGERNT